MPPSAGVVGLARSVMLESNMPARNRAITLMTREYAVRAESRLVSGRKMPTHTFIKRVLSGIFIEKVSSMVFLILASAASFGLHVMHLIPIFA